MREAEEEQNMDMKQRNSCFLSKIVYHGKHCLDDLLMDVVACEG